MSILVRNLDVKTGRCDLYSDEYDCYENNININYVLKYGQGLQVDKFEAPKLKNTIFNLSVNRYVRDDHYYCKVWVNDKKLTSDKYTITKEGFMTLAEPVYKKAKVVVQYFHDSDKRSGICAYGWMLTSGKDCKYYVIQDKDNIVMDSIGKNYYLNLLRQGKNFPISLGEGTDFNCNLKNGKYYIRLDKKLNVILGDALILTRLDNIPVYFDQSYTDLWVAKRR